MSIEGFENLWHIPGDLEGHVHSVISGWGIYFSVVCIPSNQLSAWWIVVVENMFVKAIEKVDQFINNILRQLSFCIIFQLQHKRKKLVLKRAWHALVEVLPLCDDK